MGIICHNMTYYSYIHPLSKSYSLNRIKEVLEDKQLTQVQLGEMIGIIPPEIRTV